MKNEEKEKMFLQGSCHAFRLKLVTMSTISRTFGRTRVVRLLHRLVDTSCLHREEACQFDPLIHLHSSCYLPRVSLEMQPL